MPVTETMTSRERIFAAIEGQEVDRLPVWLKMSSHVWRSNKSDRIKALSEEDLLTEAGCDLILGAGWGGVYGENPHVRTESHATDDMRVKTHETPDGTLTERQARDPYVHTWHPVEYPIKSAADLRAARWLYTDTRWQIDEEAMANQARRQEQVEQLGGFSISGVGPSPLMDLVEHLAGPESAIYLLFDEPTATGELLDLMHADRVRFLQTLLPRYTADSLWMTENTTTTLISPDMFRDICVPHLTAYGNMILEAGVIPVHHMCGTLNGILELLDPLPAKANEAYTTRPVGDVSLAEGRTRMPNKCLIGGTNASLWMQPAERIIAEVAEDLAACPDKRKIILTSAGVLPPAASMETVQRVVAAFKEM